VENLVNDAKHDLMIPMEALAGPVGLAEANQRAAAWCGESQRCQAFRDLRRPRAAAG
jgi:hypothetical protein